MSTYPGPPEAQMILAAQEGDREELARLIPQCYRGELHQLRRGADLLSSMIETALVAGNHLVSDQ